MTCKELCDSLKTALFRVKAVTFSRNSRNSLYGSCLPSSPLYDLCVYYHSTVWDRIFLNFFYAQTNSWSGLSQRGLSRDFHSQYHVIGYADFFSYQLCHRSNSTLRHVRSQKGRQRGWSWSDGCGRTSIHRRSSRLYRESAMCHFWYLTAQWARRRPTSRILGKYGGAARRSCECVCQWKCRCFENTWNYGTFSFEHSEVEGELWEHPRSKYPHSSIRNHFQKHGWKFVELD